MSFLFLVAGVGAVPCCSRGAGRGAAPWDDAHGDNGDSAPQTRTGDAGSGEGAAGGVQGALPVPRQHLWVLQGQGAPSRSLLLGGTHKVTFQSRAPLAQRLRPGEPRRGVRLSGPVRLSGTGPLPWEGPRGGVRRVRAGSCPGQGAWCGVHGVGCSRDCGCGAHGVGHGGAVQVAAWVWAAWGRVWGVGCGVQCWALWGRAGSRGPTGAPCAGCAPAAEKPSGGAGGAPAARDGGKVLLPFSAEAEMSRFSHPSGGEAGDESPPDPASPPRHPAARPRWPGGAEPAVSRLLFLFLFLPRFPLLLPGRGCGSPMGPGRGCGARLWGREGAPPATPCPSSPGRARGLFPKPPAPRLPHPIAPGAPSRVCAPCG